MGRRDHVMCCVCGKVRGTHWIGVKRYCDDCHSRVQNLPQGPGQSDLGQVSRKLKKIDEYRKVIPKAWKIYQRELTKATDPKEAEIKAVKSVYKGEKNSSRRLGIWKKYGLWPVTEEQTRQEIRLLPQEAPLYLPLPDNEGDFGGALIIHPGGSRGELLKSDAQMVPKRNFDFGSRLGNTVAAFPGIQTYLQAGKMVEIVGSRKVIEGLATGAYKTVQEGEAFLGTVRNVSTGRMAGQLRFQNISRLRVVGPLLLWQAANIVLGTIHLQRIDEKLKKLQDAIADLEKILQFNKQARAMVASEILEEVGEKYRSIGYFTDDMVFRMVTAEREIRVAYKESELMLTDFEAVARKSLEKKGKDGAYKTVSLLEDKAHKVSREIGFMADIFKAEVKAYQLGILHEMTACPENLQNSMEKIKTRIEHHKYQMEKIRVFSELAHHADACVSEMGWFSRHITDRGLPGRANEHAGKWKNLPVNESRSDTAGDIYLVWQEKNKVWTKRLESSHEG